MADTPNPKKPGENIDPGQNPQNMGGPTFKPDITGGEKIGGNKVEKADKTEKAVGPDTQILDDEQIPAIAPGDG